MCTHSRARKKIQLPRGQNEFTGTKLGEGYWTVIQMSHNIQYSNRGTNVSKLCLDFLDPCFYLIVLLILQSWNCFWLDIITNKITEATFTCPLDYQTSIFTCLRAKLTCPGKLDLGFFVPCCSNVLLSLDIFWTTIVLFIYIWSCYLLQVWRVPKWKKSTIYQSHSKGVYGAENQNIRCCT